MDYARIAKHCRHVEGKLFAAFEKRKQLLLEIAHVK